MPPEYFKRSLRPHEAEQYLDGLMMRQRAGWEQARLIVSPWQGKDSPPLTFPWEKEDAVAPTREEFDELMDWSIKAEEVLRERYGRHSSKA